MSILRLSAALAVAMTLSASTARADVIDFSDALGPSGQYSNQAYYQGMLGGQPMTAAQQAYSSQEDQLRMLGFLSELGGNFGLGQALYHLAYGITPPPSASDLASEGSDSVPPSMTSGGPANGASGAGDTGGGLPLTTSGDTGSGRGGSGSAGSGSTGSDLTYGSMTSVSLTAVDVTLSLPAPVPEASTWVMLLLGFAGLGFASFRGWRKIATVAE
ncbi:MAG: PEP-CTERM sorting domain-containing protein [Hyphomicrobiales bacterium]|nr:PEP-CTERM sorting domain-containing protein [Hyphomicrobiales bacterium]MBV9909498.1 PEP-CTERM sorting domain-containing protein [Hyphomicrobiales bacterium]